MRILVTAALAAAIALPAQAAPTNVSATQSTIKYSSTSAGGSGFGNFTRATSTVVYDPVTDTYTLRDTGSLTTKSTFAPANIDAGASNATFTVYKKTSGSSTETFRLLNKSPTNPLIALSYSTASSSTRPESMRSAAPATSPPTSARARSLMMRPRPARAKAAGPASSLAR